MAAEIEVTGWTRTALLAVGAGVGVLITAGLLHLAKEWGLIK
jgi:uncharacterized membrane protein YhiD involved in acid resistance